MMRNDRKAMKRRTWLTMFSVASVGALAFVFRYGAVTADEAIFLMGLFNMVALANIVFWLVPVVEMMYPKEGERKETPQGRESR